MKVMQCPIEIAGQMGILSKGLQEVNVRSEAFNTFHTYLGYRDYVHNLDIYELEWIQKNAIQYFDLFHYHYASTMAPDFSDLAAIHSLKKPMAMHHWGNDVRTHSIAAQHNPYIYTGDSPPPDQVAEKLQQLSRYIKHAIVQDYEVYPHVSSYYEHVHVLPIAFDVFSVTPLYPSTVETDPLVIHAPTNPLFKGTEQIEAAIEKLKGEGIRFRYQRIEKMSNADALKLYQQADLIIDQILCGSYGLLAVESMSMGKPVVGYIREDLKNTFPEVPPIISANPDQIYATLKQVLTSPKLRYEAGKNGRAYVERHHDVGHVVQQLLSIYHAIE